MEMNKIQRLVALVFTGVGGILLVICGVMWLIPGIPAAHRGETQATITDIALGATTRVGSHRRTVHDVMVEYEVDGQLYKRALNYYNSNMYTGQTMVIQYDTREPGKINVPGVRMLMTLVLGGMGIIFLGLGILLLVKPTLIQGNGRQVQ